VAEGKSLWRKLAFRAELAENTKLTKTSLRPLRLYSFVTFVLFRGYLFSVFSVTSVAELLFRISAICVKFSIKNAGSCAQKSKNPKFF
jgi:hypothetical protein